MLNFTLGSQQKSSNDNRLVINGTQYLVSDNVIQILMDTAKKNPDWFLQSGNGSDWTKVPEKKAFDKPFNPDTYTKDTFLSVSDPEMVKKGCYKVSVNWTLSGQSVWTVRNGKRCIKSDLLKIVNAAAQQFKGSYEPENKVYCFGNKVNATKFAQSCRVISADRRKAVWAEYNKDKG